MGVGLGAGVGGEAGAEGSRLWGIVDESGLVGVMMGRGAPERDMRPLRPWTLGEVYMAEREDEAVALAEAAMSVSESSMWAAGASRWSPAGVK